MSRVANNPVSLPKGVEVKVDAGKIAVKGGKGALEMNLVAGLDIEVTEGEAKVIFDFDTNRTMAGTTRALLNNLVVGVSEGWEKKLILNGVGYRAKATGKTVNLTIGLSHPVDYELPEGISAETPTQTEIVIRGMDKQAVGQAAAEIRSFRPPEPYKGKGIRYADEHVRRKEAKKKYVGRAMNQKNESRLRRARRSRTRMRTAGATRLSVHRTPRHIYAQVIGAEGNTVLASASTLDKDLRAGATGNVDAASKVGALIAERAKAAGVTAVSFDRGGFKYHGRVKALADAAREGGLEF